MTTTLLSHPAIPRLAGAHRLMAVGVAVAACMMAGATLRLRPDAYVLLSLPMAVGFQRLVAHRPLRDAWVRGAQPVRWTPGRVLSAALLAIAPLHACLLGLAAGNAVTFAFGIVAAAGAQGTVLAITSLGPTGRRSLVRLLAGLGFAGAAVGWVLLDGDADAAAALVAGVRTTLLYLPAMFVVEEVLFRGVFDTYLAPSVGPGGGGVRQALSMGVVAALWGAWHAPLYPGAGPSALLVLVAYHVLVGVPLSWLWRRTGNLAYPALAHAIVDGVRNAMLVA